MSARVVLSLLASLFVVACAEPPRKEMDQAQGALDAARAAGAEQYAAEEYAAAVTALESSHEAVELEDYRSALNYAIDSRERAQNAAKLAAEQRAALQSGAERALTELRLLVERGEERLESSEARRVPRPVVLTVRGELANATNALQEASAAMAQGDYAAVRRRLEGVYKDALAAMAELDAALADR